MRNPHRDSKAKTIAIAVFAICALAYLIGMDWYYWPRDWPHGSTSSWRWLWVTVFLAAAPFAIIWRIRRWASRIDLRENIRMRKDASKPKPAERDESDGL